MVHLVKGRTADGGNDAGEGESPVSILMGEFTPKRGTRIVSRSGGIHWESTSVYQYNKVLRTAIK